MRTKRPTGRTSAKASSSGTATSSNKNCENVKFLKTGNGGSFFEEFARRAQEVQPTSDSQEGHAFASSGTPMVCRLGEPLCLPEGTRSLVQPLFPGRTRGVTNDKAQTKLIELTVNGIDDARHLHQPAPRVRGSRARRN